VNLQPINDPLNVIEPNPNSNRTYSKCYRALELYADSIGMRVVEYGGAGNSLFLVRPRRLLSHASFSIPESQAEAPYSNTPVLLASDSRSLLRMCLPTTSLTVALQNLQACNLARTTRPEFSRLTINHATIRQRQRHLDQDALRLASKRPPQLPPGRRPPAHWREPRPPLEALTGERPRLGLKLSLWNFGNIAQGHWVALVPLIDQNDLRAQHMNPDP
jgi:hypothetical protein